jgi:FkbM family methyltransferase
MLKNAKRMALYWLQRRGYHVSHESVIPPSGDHRRMLAALKKRGLHCDFILDIGAFVCGWADWALVHWPDARVWAFEPSSEPRPYRDDLMQRRRNIRLFPTALGNVNQTLTLTWNPGSLGSAATLLVPKNDSGTCVIDGKRWTQTQVAVRRLNDVLQEEKECNVPNLVKIDVEGYELEVLKGASAILGKTEVFITETMLLRGEISGVPTPGELISFMEDAGYALYDFADLGYEPSSGRIWTTDFVFVRNDSPLLRNPTHRQSASI